MLPRAWATAAPVYLLTLCYSRVARAFLPLTSCSVVMSDAGNRESANPFDEFALGASPSASKARPAALSLATNDSKVAKKLRMSSGGPAEQKPAKGLIEKYRCERKRGGNRALVCSHESGAWFPPHTLLPLSREQQHMRNFFMPSLHIPKYVPHRCLKPWRECM